MNNWTLPNDTALVVVDIQKDFCPDGALAVAGGDEIIDDVNKLIPHFGLRIFTQDFHPPGHASFASSHPGKKPYDTIELPYTLQTLWPDHCVQGTEGADFHPMLEKGANPIILQKGKNPDIDSYSGFFENDKKTHPTFDDGQTLTQFLREKGIRRVVFAGLAYDFCVGWHALDAKKEGFEAFVLKNLTRSIAIPVTLPNGQKTNTEALMDGQLDDAGVHIIHAEDLPSFFPPTTDAPGFHI